MSAARPSGRKTGGGLALWRGPLAVGAALMLLLAATLGLAYLPMGAANGPVSYAIALLKALLVALVFMKLVRSPALFALAALAGCFWLAALFTMTLTDYPFRLAGERLPGFPQEAPADPAPVAASGLPR
ncbi:hypothetical protein GCM10011390_28550 [Aureimonas endophytica]|uniref:Caa(3)-type oxidase subunit IV n=1 Tax=Aureimonas endophytica TaxID=2027858 RepID=A0A916ZPJ8_9HYPH|nr:cytochrome C oxidase subunit IV family protein [Aureimonas endophytica]GGE07806.1 hypothetical protein GCM10011390_28550 [Aureimonas endophytica]